MIYNPKPDDIRPLIGVSACTELRRDGRFEYVVFDQYVQAIHRGAHGVPLLIPGVGSAHDLAALIERLDGLLLTGSPSNVEAHHYHGTPLEAGALLDPQRDSVTLPLIRMALAERVPILAICRGMQELNVALGGTLHAKIHEVPGFSDHYAYRDDPDINQIYAPAHPINLHQGGVLSELAGSDSIIVNSIHNQGIDRLAPGLMIEAQASDGVIEAVHVADANSFAVGVQWHPEWHFDQNPFGTALFRAFGAACRARAAAR